MTHSNRPKMYRLMGVYAHPDDETFGNGGTLALYARRGAETHVVCATRGEVGEAPEDRRGYDSIAAMREAELDCAAKILELTSLRYLGYRDSGMTGSEHNVHPECTANAPVEDVARRIAYQIREVQPQVVITFDPIGGYRHPDHIAVHRGTVEAFRMASDASIELGGLAPYTPQKLYFSTFSRRLLRFAVRVMRLTGRDPTRFGTNKDVDIASLAEVDFPIHATISVKEVAEIKARASACHASQGGGRFGSRPVQWFSKLLGASEQFMRAVPATPPAQMERDLFEGVR
jgi:N-acetyl-1-D-myo-inositol-2-amino-2-deoxy-alpha-D-glucopyranoside deacetylase